MSSFVDYYKLFWLRWWSEFWGARGKQFSAFAVVNVITLLLSRNEPTTWAKTKPTVWANLITFGVFAIWHLIRVPALLHTDQERHMSDVAHQAEELKEQMQKLKAVPARITVTPRELRRTLRLHDKQKKRNIFCWQR